MINIGADNGIHGQTGQHIDSETLVNALFTYTLLINAFGFSGLENIVLLLSTEVTSPPRR